MWFALFQEVNVEGDLPAWGVAALLVTRFLADLVGAWLAVTMLQLAIASVRLGWSRGPLHRERR